MAEAEATRRLLEAVEAGDESAVLAAIQEGADCQFLCPQSDPDCHGGTLLLKAVVRGHTHLVPVLTKAGVGVNGRGKVGYTPLHAAAACGGSSVIPVLAAAGADVNCVATGGFAFTPMHMAAYRGDEASVASLVAAGANIDVCTPRKFTPLHTAAQHGHDHLVKLLIESGCDRHACSSTGMTALHMAAMQGLKSTAKLLLKYGLDPEARDENGHTPETCADVWGMNDIRWWFSKLQNSKPTPLTRGKLHADSQEVYEYDHKNLDSNVRAQEWFTLKDVIPKTRDGHYQDSRGHSFLHLAASLGHHKTVEVLIELCDIYPGVLTHHGQTADQLARQNGHFDVAEAVVQARTRYETGKSKEGLYGELLGVISTGDDVKKASEVMKAGAPLEPTGEYSTHALVLAITSNRPRIVSLLLAAGASVNITFHRLNLVQVAWLSPDVTAMVSMLITRHMENVLQEEKALCESTELCDGIDCLLNALRSQTPWKAAWPIQSSGKPQQQQLLTSLMVEAARANCALTALFLQQAGALAHGNDVCSGVSPMVAAVKEGHQRLVYFMAKTTGSLYIRDAVGQLPRDLLSPSQRQELEKMIYEQEMRVLNHQEEKMKDEEDKQLLRKIQELQQDLYKRHLAGEAQSDKPAYEKDIVRRTLLVASQLGLIQLPFILITTGIISVDDEVDPITETTALHQAAAYGHKNLVAVLLDLGADITCRDAGGYTPAHLAAMFGYSLVYKQLWSPQLRERLICKAGTTPSDICRNFGLYLKKYRKSGKVNDLPDTNDPLMVFQNHFHSLTLPKLIEMTAEDSVDFSSGEAAEIRDAVMAELEILKRKVAAKNPMFNGDLKLLGSSRDNTRLFAPDEFDVNLVISHLPEVKVEIYEFPKLKAMAKGHKLCIEVESEDPDLEKNLLASVWKNTFYNLTCESLKHHHFHDSRLSLVPPGVTRTQVGAAIQMAWQGSQYPLLLIGVDLVPVITTPWPPNFPKPYLTPSQADNETLGITNIEDSQWRFSFAETEAVVLQGLSPEERQVYMTCKTLLYSFKAERWMPREVKNRYTWWDCRPWKIATPPGFALKNCFFKRLEEKRKRGEEWEEGALVRLMVEIFRLMCHYFQRSGDEAAHLVPSKVPAYFGGDFERPKVGFGAVQIVKFLESIM
ncbi:serine/threonine-protein phosphatase 6 regulatory ankyrin repeat subunit A-like isoform X1 [Penaeus japonicus]|uniref:serine/threonine-protein phosphatase 6 regulatory ankyrin repeat subunit A-like isoform X1 n=1 Tax=Penaeus japonicus TaxID=27405 RepID=UPI001C7169B2|nr:serine/threonine-protein phosphatase 6 regulatory ankyrin repeat subunit A-like isoform X1 [Penaeus japonicus]XP_042858931.1 serine/threonine-protein phosphatase 6 regulatory ankyrin repeat subunit A-like isoform X1 [Penaeus japonicus]